MAPEYWSLNLNSADSVCFDRVVDRVCPTELRLNGAGSSDAGAPFLGLGLMVQFPPGFVVDGTILVLVWSVSLFWMAVSPGVPRVGCACLNLFDSPGLLRVLVALDAVVGPLLPGFLGGAIVVLGFVGRFRGFIADAVPCWGNIVSV